MIFLEEQHATSSRVMYRNSDKDIPAKKSRERISGLEPNFSGSDTASEE
jgi:hypothetical protein